MRIVESTHAKFLENNTISGSDQLQNTTSIRDQPSTSSQKLIVRNTPEVQLGVEKPINEIPQAVENMHIDEVVQVIPHIIEQPVEQHNPQEYVGATLRRSTREIKSAISSHFVVYLQESDIAVENDPEYFSQAMNS